jgi:hypothetical protein
VPGFDHCSRIRQQRCGEPLTRIKQGGRQNARQIMRAKECTMKTIVAAFLAMSVLAGLAGQASAASVPEPNTTLNIAAAEYDFPDFGSQHWWDLQQDRG